ncbi:unnamed protein product [Ceutorhynchus assimilis]|uniref:Nicotinamide-nucleotide adenylyltransferase n=1 Tax=Ceutorhynchus assimilis TaxID=467358 RepID=A0A9N9MJ63_9CUCU|nr:unnamed protein product [Ceutorhynchus assimilis]
MPAPVILLACGCYNPVTYMHLRMFEIARDYLHKMGQYEVVGGIISPVHDAYGKKGLAPAAHRLGMLKLALKDSNWIKVSDYEAKEESWTRTKNVLQFHQNQVNAFLHSNVNEEELKWLPDSVKTSNYNNIVVKLLCGGDLLESFGTPNLWANEDIEAIVGQHGLIVITRSNTNPNEFVYNSDILTKLMPQIQIVTEWISNEISSTRIRTALRRSESVKYLIPDQVIDYIYKNQLYGAKNKTA